MGGFTKFTGLHEAPHQDMIRIKRRSNGHNTISGYLRIASFTDKDTLHKVVYLPSMEMSGYGTTEVEAVEMLKFSLTEFFDSILSIPLKDMKKELAKYGWKVNPYRTKEYSKSFVDPNGHLQDFNAVEGHIEVGYLAV